MVTLVLVLVALVFVLWPLFRTKTGEQSKRSATNIKLYRERLAELQTDFDEERLSKTQFQQLTTELQRRLLEDSEKEEQGQATGKLSPQWVAAIALVVPLIAWGLYQQIGAKADWQITQTLKQISAKAGNNQPVEDDIQRLVEQLNQRLSQKPESPDYLMLLGNTQMRLNNYPAATEAFQRLSEQVPNDALVLASYAQALYLSSNRQLSDRVQSLAEQALAINPRQTTVLSMLGIANFEQGNFQQAIEYWQQLLPAMPADSPNRRMIMAGIAQAKARLGQSDNEAAAAVSLSIDVSLADTLEADADASVFVYARAVGGPPMPLAVQRLTVSDLPARVRLDDSMAMMPAMKLSGFPQVELIARISKQGIANRGSGDLEGVLSPVRPAETTAPLTLQINQRVP